MRIQLNSPVFAALVVFLTIASRTCAQKPSHLDVSAMTDECVRGGQLPSAADCGKWAARSQALDSAPCPDSHGATACRSFRELLRSHDAALMSELAHQDHIYVCFIPGTDEFFKVTYSDPPAVTFVSPSPAQVKSGISSDALIAPGAADFVYYKAGVEDSESSVRDTGNWIYVATNAADPDTMRANLNLHQARFKSRHMVISGGEWNLSQTYTSENRSQVTHTLALQLATGRFRQEYALADSGAVQGTSSGRCLIAPPAN